MTDVPTAKVPPIALPAEADDFSEVSRPAATNIVDLREARARQARKREEPIRALRVDLSPMAAGKGRHGFGAITELSHPHVVTKIRALLSDYTFANQGRPRGGISEIVQTVRDGRQLWVVIAGFVVYYNLSLLYSRVEIEMIFGNSGRPGGGVAPDAHQSRQQSNGTAREPTKRRSALVRLACLCALVLCGTIIPFALRLMPAPTNIAPDAWHKRFSLESVLDGFPPYVEFPRQTTVLPFPHIFSWPPSFGVTGHRDPGFERNTFWQPAPSSHTRLANSTHWTLSLAQLREQGLPFLAELKAHYALSVPANDDRAERGLAKVTSAEFEERWNVEEYGPIGVAGLTKRMTAILAVPEVGTEMDVPWHALVKPTIALDQPAAQVTKSAAKSGPSTKVTDRDRPSHRQTEYPLDVRAARATLISATAGP
jgi:hypothetical protein